MCGAIRIHIGCNELRPFANHADSSFNQFEVERSSFTDHDVIRIVIDDRVSVGVQRVEQSAFADHVRGAARFLHLEKFCCCSCACVNVLVFDLDPHPRELCADIPTGSLTVVGKKSERNIAFAQFLHEAIRASDHLRAAIKNAIHVD